jgi:hypothetical protein
MTVQPTPNSHNRHRAFQTRQAKPSASTPVKLHKPDNHLTWLQISLFLDPMPKRGQVVRS